MTRLLIGMTGSLGILSMPSYLTFLKREFSSLKVIMTHSATQFLPKETVQLLVEETYVEEFPLCKKKMTHVELARWADVFLVIPATAHFLFQAAHGYGGSLLSTTLLAYERRVIFFPNMNRAMWENKAVQRNIDILKRDGHEIIPPVERASFEAASKEMRTNPVLPSEESVLSIIQLERDLINPLSQIHA